MTSISARLVGSGGIGLGVAVGTGVAEGVGVRVTVGVSLGVQLAGRVCAPLVATAWATSARAVAVLRACSARMRCRAVYPAAAPPPASRQRARMPRTAGSGLARRNLGTAATCDASAAGEPVLPRNGMRRAAPGGAAAEGARLGGAEVVPSGCAGSEDGRAQSGIAG